MIWQDIINTSYENILSGNIAANLDMSRGINAQIKAENEFKKWGKTEKQTSHEHISLRGQSLITNSQYYSKFPMQASKKCVWQNLQSLTLCNAKEKYTSRRRGAMLSTAFSLSE